MSDDHYYFIGIYWGMRRETMDECANEIKATFDLLNRMDNSFAEWYKTARPRKGQAVAPLEIQDTRGIKAILLDSRNYNDAGELLEELGYTIYIKSSRDFSKAHILSVRCGGYHERASNCVALNIGKTEAYSHLQNMDFARKIYTVLIEIWKPDSGVIRCDDTDVVLEKF